MQALQVPVPAAPFRAERNCRAFTLIELLVTIALIAILAALLFPSLASAKERARRAACQGCERQFLLALHLYGDDNDQRLPTGASDFGPLDSHLPVICKGTSNSLVQYLSQRRMLHCPSYAEYFKGKPVVQFEAAGYGYVIGYNYHGGHTNTPWTPLTDSTNTWISPQRLTDDNTLVVLSDMNDWSTADRRTFAPHGQRGPILTGTDISNQGQPGRWRGTSAQIGAAGGNIAVLDGSIRWKKAAQMKIYRGSRLFMEDGCVAMW